MKISQLIQKLQEQKAENGDMEVILPQRYTRGDDGVTHEVLAKVSCVEAHLDTKDNQVKLAIY